ncbi:MAG TPA: Fe-S cluster assembly protein HesB [Bacteroidota bacterium]
MNTSHFSITTPTNFRFWRTVYSHGWSSLQPFRIDKAKQAFERLVELSDRTLALCTLQERRTGVSVQAESKKPLNAAQKKEIQAQLSACFRLNDDMTAFYAEARKLRKFKWVPRMGAGRMLRSPTVFEDVVKMICTTNCSWALTEIMVKNLTTKLGRQFNATTYSFPSPKALAGTTERFLRKEIRSGYRSPYFLELAEYVASGKLDMESWRTSELPTDELFKHVRSVKGMGDYAAGNIMKLLGRYDYLGLDSWVRGKYYEIHKNGRKVSDTTIERHYAPYGMWQGLFFWLEMTKDWYEHKFPF